jgi:hypothetical protein
MILTRSVMTAASVLAAGFLTAGVVQLTAGRPSAQFNTRMARVAAFPARADGVDHDSRPTAIRKDIKLAEAFRAPDEVKILCRPVLLA